MNEDFCTALGMIRSLFRHSIHVYNRLPVKKAVDEKQNLRLSLLHTLPASFSGKEFLEATAQLNIPKTTAYKVLKLFIQEGFNIRKARYSYLLNETKDLWETSLWRVSSIFEHWN